MAFPLTHIISSPFTNSSSDNLLQEYSRPVYVYTRNHYLLDQDDPDKNDLWALIYSGNRWFGVFIDDNKYKPIEEWILGHTSEYHPMWDEIYSSNTVMVSDITTSSTPVGVDWYWIGEKSDQFGPFGEMIPMQLWNQTGRGLFRCGGSEQSSKQNSTRITRERRLHLRKAFGPSRRDVTRPIN